MDKGENLANLRREYGQLTLDENTTDPCPIVQFQRWFSELLTVETHDPNAMVLATVDEKGYPDARVVLLKGLEAGCFLFYTNYQSTKALQLAYNPHAVLNFYWPQMVRQVRIRGQIKRASKQQSDAYFASRPVTSQIAAMVSHQSQTIPDRATLENLFNSLLEHYANKPIPRPRHWGGYKLIPTEIEFWQGRDNRLHDRILYYKKKNHWERRRLAP